MMNGLVLDRCVRGYATENSLNVASDSFVKALGLHLGGDQGGALRILSELEEKYLRDERHDELLEVQQLKIACYLTNGEIQVAETLARDMLEYSKTEQNDRWIGLALVSGSMISAYQGHSSYAIDTGERAKQLLVSFGNPVDLARACSALGYGHILAGNLEAACRELETAANLSKASDAPTIQAAACRRLAFAHMKGAKFKEADRSYLETLQIYKSIRASRRLAQINFSLASMYCLLSDVSKAKGYLEAAESSVKLTIQGLGVSRRVLLRAWIALLEGEPMVSLEHLQTILPEFVERGAQRDEALCHEFLGDAYRALGEFDRAQEHYDRGLEKGRMVSVTSDVVLECLRKTAELKLEEGNIERSLITLRRALKLAVKTGDKFERACLIRLRGQLKHSRGKRAAASRLLEAAWHDFRTMGASVEANRTAGTMSAQLRMEGKVEEARVWTRLAGGGTAPEGADMKGVPRGRRLSKDLRSTVQEARAAGIITSDPRILKSFQLAVRAAKSHLPALILGETGSGKELFASTIHAYSEARGSFIPINCAALPADILDAELFGHSRGAFTGAFRDRVGLIESASGGTLFLDEIGEMALPVQGRLLRAIELGEIRRLGESKPRNVSTRFIAATHRDLEEMVRKGTFRADLFFRLKGIIIPVPPLRERTWDVDILVDNFLALMGQKYHRTVTLSDEARERLRCHPWPGNVRELKSVIERLVSMNENGAVIDAYDLEIGEIRYSISLEEHLEQEEKRRLVAILESVQWNKSAASRILKMKRTTLLGKLKRLGIQAPPRR